jgi:Predicted xylanase/chitin deacetylase
MIAKLLLPLTLTLALTIPTGGDIFFQHKNDNMKVALTFDDGPHSVYTAEILDILNEYGIKATFFVIGVNAELYPDIISRTIREGHEIGNHTYHHNKYRDNDVNNIENEIIMTEKVLYEIAEYKPKMFRPPGGYCCAKLSNIVTELDYSVALWSVDTYDWNPKCKDSQLIADTVIDNIKSGGIILCHDYVDKSVTPEALRIFIPKLLEAGYQFVTVSELIRTK